MSFDPSDEVGYLILPMNYMIVLPPIVGTIIGWLTNYVAIKMLFRPRRHIKILGFGFQGLIPKRRKEIALSIAETIASQLLSTKDIAAVIEDIDIESEIEKTVKEAVEHRFKSDKIKKIPIVGLITDNFTYHMKYFITKELLKHLNIKKGEMVNKFKEKVDIRGMVTSQIDNLDLKGFEDMLNNIIAKELRHIEWIGAGMGFIIGLSQVGLIYLLR